MSVLETSKRLRSGNIHLLSAEDEALLHWGDTLLLFNALLYAGDLVPQN